MLQETTMLYKLTILYLLSRAGDPLSGNSLSSFLLEKDFTDYFNLQQIMGELIDDGYVNKSIVRNKILYSLTEDGARTIKLLSRELSGTMKAEVDRYISECGIELKEDTSVMANYYQVDISHYIANMYIEENGDRLLEMNISVPTAADAENICSHWYNATDTLYPLIMKELLK